MADHQIATFRFNYGLYGVIVAASIVYYVIRYFADEEESEIDKTAVGQSFQILFERCIRPTYGDQNSETLLTIKTGMLRTITDDEPEPFFMVFLNTRNKGERALLLAIKLIQISLMARGEEMSCTSIYLKYVLNGGDFDRVNSPWHFYQTVKRRVAENQFLIIYRFQDIPSDSISVFSHYSSGRFFAPGPAFLFLIIDIEEIEGCGSTRLFITLKTMKQWVNKKLKPYLDDELTARTEFTLLQRVGLIRPFS